jgi:hypothetical protein
MITFKSKCSCKKSHFLSNETDPPPPLHPKVFLHDVASISPVVRSRPWHRVTTFSPESDFFFPMGFRWVFRSRFVLLRWYVLFSSYFDLLFSIFSVVFSFLFWRELVLFRRNLALIVLFCSISFSCVSPFCSSIVFPATSSCCFSFVFYDGSGIVCGGARSFQARFQYRFVCFAMVVDVLSSLLARFLLLHGGGGLPLAYPTEVWLMLCGMACRRYKFLWLLSNLLRFARFFFESLLVPNSIENCRSLCIWFGLFRVGIDCFGGGLRDKTRRPRFSCYCRLINFGPRSCFLDSDGPVNFDSRSEVIV